jgi:hypothetical protein
MGARDAICLEPQGVFFLNHFSLIYTNVYLQRILYDCRYQHHHHRCALFDNDDSNAASPTPANYEEIGPKRQFTVVWAVSSSFFYYNNTYVYYILYTIYCNTNLLYP